MLFYTGGRVMIFSDVVRFVNTLYKAVEDDETLKVSFDICTVEVTARLSSLPRLLKISGVPDEFKYTEGSEIALCWDFRNGWFSYL